MTRHFPKINFHKLAAESSESIASNWSYIFTPIRGSAPFPVQDDLAEAFRVSAASGLNTDDWEAHRELAENTHWQLRWRDFGYPCFHLTHSLAAALLLTDCSEVKGRDLKFPFPSFLITLPRPKGLIQISDMETSEPTDAGWISVHTIRLPKNQDGGEKLHSSLIDGSYMFKTPNIEWEYVSVIRTLDSHGVGVFKRNKFPGPDDTLEEWLTSYHPLEGKYLLKETELDKSAAHASLRLLVNLCFYLDAQSAQGKKLPKQKMLRRKWKPGRGSGPPVPPAWILGRELKLDSELVEAARNTASPNPKTRAEWELKSQHVVRGHWRNQPYGPKRSLRKRVWIEPHWRGPRASEAIVRNFTSKDG